MTHKLLFFMSDIVGTFGHCAKEPCVHKSADLAPSNATHSSVECFCCLFCCVCEAFFKPQRLVWKGLARVPEARQDAYSVFTLCA